MGRWKMDNTDNSFLDNGAAIDAMKSTSPPFGQILRVWAQALVHS